MTEGDVRAIRAAVAGGESQASVAKRYGVTQVCICFVVNRKTWAWLDCEADAAESAAVSEEARER